MSNQSDREHARALLEQYTLTPTADLAFRTALALDKVGRESAAIGYYISALDSGLPNDHQKIAYACLASSYRNLHRYQEAIHLLEKVRKKFLHDPVIEAFYALALYDTGQPCKAVQTLGDVLIKSVPTEKFYGLSSALQGKFRGLSWKKHS